MSKCSVYSLAMRVVLRFKDEKGRCSLEAGSGIVQESRAVAGSDKGELYMLE